MREAWQERMNEMGPQNTLGLLSQLNVNPAYVVEDDMYVTHFKSTYTRPQTAQCCKVNFRKKDEMSMYAEAWVKFRSQLRHK